MTQNSPNPLWQYIKTVPNFPKAGVDFYDITPLLEGHTNALANALLGALPTGLFDKVEYLCAIESRGFILAGLLAGKTGKPLLLIRKKGKLPPPVYSEHYALEYGFDTLEIQDTAQMGNVLIVDDVLATGGTLTAAARLCKKAGHTVLGALVLLDLKGLHGDMPLPIHNVLQIG